MGLWSRLLDWATAARSADEPVAEDEDDAPAEGQRNTVELPVEPFVFECQACGKVFEARRKRPQCPECDSPDVSLMSA